MPHPAPVPRGVGEELIHAEDHDAGQRLGRAPLVRVAQRLVQRVQRLAVEGAALAHEAGVALGPAQQV